VLKTTIDRRKKIIISPGWTDIRFYYQSR